jgi:predicted transcriptional regulator
MHRLITEVYQQLAGLSMQPAGARQPHTPCIAVEDSVKDDYIVCLEDGKQVKMLKRYLKATYRMSPDEYRARWNLPADYPMVAPNYTQVRSRLAKEIGLGRRGLPAAAKTLGEKRAGLR